MNEIAKPPVGVQFSLLACQLGLLGIREMPGVGQPADDALLLASIFFGGAVVGSFAISAFVRRVMLGKAA